MKFYTYIFKFLFLSVLICLHNANAKDQNVVDDLYATDGKNQQLIAVAPKKLFINLDFSTQPNLFVTNLQGEQMPLRKERGNMLILFFFATWCANCKDELLNLNRLYEKLIFHSITDVKIIPISIDFKKPPVIEDFFYRQKLTMAPYLDPTKSVFASFGLKSLPSSVIINKQGYILASYEEKVPWNDEDVFKDILLLKDFKPQDSVVNFNTTPQDDSLHFTTEKSKTKQPTIIK